jgi:hypothetical protein
MWDFNIAFDNCNFNGGDSPYGWQYQVYATENFVPFWWWQFMLDDTFKNSLKCRYQYLRGNVLSLAALYQHIDSMALYLDESQIRNFQRWPILGQYVHPNSAPVQTTYSGEINNLKDFITQRINWMDANMPGLCQVGIADNEPGEMLLNAYPNPFTGNITLSYLIAESGKLKIDMVNLLGDEIQPVLEEDKPAGHYQNVISTAHLPSGVYMVRMTMNDRVTYRKVIKM